MAIVLADVLSAGIGVGWTSPADPTGSYWVVAARVGRVGGGLVTGGVQVQDLPPGRGLFVYLPTVPRYWFSSLLVSGGSGLRIYLPFWLPAAIAGLALLRSRAPPGPPPAYLCVQCGYDLRGISAARCPECGTPVPADSPSGPGSRALG